MDYSNLNIKQKEAVLSKDNNIFVVSGAGCGKTTVLTERIIHLIESGVNEENIFAFTFTNKSANDMKYKLESKLGHKTKATLMTFHAFALKVLKINPSDSGFQNNFTLISEGDKRKILSNLIESLNVPVDEKVILRDITLFKNKSPLSNMSDTSRLILEKVLRSYQEILKKSNKMDFDDLLLNLLNLFNNYYYCYYDIMDKAKYILVDEAQDINRIQYEILLKLSSLNNHLFMVGDSDQSIYAFRGSDTDCLSDFIVNKKATLIKLEENYRSTKTILDAANGVINNNSNRVDKTLYTKTYKNDYKIVVSKLESDIEEAYYIKELINVLIENNYNYKDIAILYRNNNISEKIEKELLTFKIPYYIFGNTPFFERKEIKYMIYYLNFFINHNDDISLKEIINTPSRLIGDKLINKILTISNDNNISIYNAILSIKHEYQALENFIKLVSKFDSLIEIISPKDFLMSLLKEIKYFDLIRPMTNSKNRINNIYLFLDYLDNIPYSLDNKKSIADFLNSLTLDNLKDVDKDKGKVKLMTIHQSKGLEFKVVILAGLNDRILPSSRITLKGIEEERRLFYVAITRAKERLYLLSSRTRFINGRIEEFKESMFLNEIRKDLIIND